MAVEPSLLAPALLLAVGAVIRYLGRAELVAGIATPVVAPEVTAEFVGDFVIAVGLVTLAVTALEIVVGLPELVWLAFGVGVVLAVVAIPVLAGRYVEWRVRRTDDG